MTDLTIADRLVLLSLLPAEGTLVTMRVVRDLKRALGFSEDELARYGLRVEGNQYTCDDWSPTKAVEIGPVACSVLHDAFRAASKLTEQHLATYDKLPHPAPAE